jgi:hypothetical protein
MRISTLFPREEKGLAHHRNVNAQVRGLDIHRWRYLPLTRTRRKAADLRLCHNVALTNPVPAPKPSAKRPGSLHDHLDECDITDLVTPTAKAPPLPRRCLRLEPQERQVPPAHRRCPPDVTHSTSYEGNADGDASVAAHAGRSLRAHCKHESAVDA